MIIKREENGAVRCAVHADFKEGVWCRAFELSHKHLDIGVDDGTVRLSRLSKEDPVWQELEVFLTASIDAFLTSKYGE